LSEVWAAGRPAIVPPIGALAERVAGSGAGWVWTEEEWREEARMLDRIEALIADAEAIREAARHARALAQPTAAEMAARTVERYRSALAADRPRARLATRIARAALRWRHTPVGRALYRLAPAPLVAALKDRFR
jgi:hypothetical protein